MKGPAVTMQINSTTASDVTRFREMAESCRRMAATSHRPGPLLMLMRAEHYERTAPISSEEISSGTSRGVWRKPRPEAIVPWNRLVRSERSLVPAAVAEISPTRGGSDPRLSRIALHNLTSLIEQIAKF